MFINKFTSIHNYFLSSEDLNSYLEKNLSDLGLFN